MATGGGGARPAAYWREWNSCAPNNRAEEAAANGGRQAGWVLVDDLLQVPGIAVGDTAITSCPQALNILEARDTFGAVRADDPAYVLASQVLTADFNLSVGAASCPAAEEAVVAGHVLLSSLRFTGTGNYSQPAEPRVLAAVQDTTDLLAAYNAGELCR